MEYSNSFASQYVTEASVIEWLRKQNVANYFLRTKVGTYAGDAAATKAITGVGFKPTWILIYCMANAKAISVKTTADTTKCFVASSAGGTLYVDDVIISLDTDGFTVGDGTGSANYANEAATSYVFLAFG